MNFLIASVSDSSNRRRILWALAQLLSNSFFWLGFGYPNPSLINLGLHEERDLVRNALMNVLSDGKVRTRDIGGFSSTKQFTQAVINCIQTEE